MRDTNMKKYLILLICCLFCACQKPSAQIEQKEPSVETEVVNTQTVNESFEQTEQDQPLVQEELSPAVSEEQPPESEQTPAQEYEEKPAVSIFKVISNNDIDTLKELLVNGVDLKQKDDFKGTPLQYAAETERTEIVKLLAENGADVNAITENKKPPLYYAVINDNKEMAKILLNNGANVGGILATAVEYNYHCDLDMVKLLISKGGKVNALKEEKKLSSCGGDECYKTVKYSALYAALQRQKNIQEEKKAIMEEIKDQASYGEFSELDSEEQLAEYKQMEKEIKAVISFLKSKGATSIYKENK